MATSIVDTKIKHIAGIIVGYMYQYTINKIGFLKEHWKWILSQHLDLIHNIQDSLVSDILKIKIFKTGWDAQEFWNPSRDIPPARQHFLY